MKTEGTIIVELASGGYPFPYGFAGLKLLFLNSSTVTCRQVISMSSKQTRKNPFWHLTRKIAAMPPPTKSPPPSRPVFTPKMSSAPTMKRAAPPILMEDASFERFMGLIRDVRVEAQNIAKSIADIKKACELTDKKVRDQELKASLEHNLKIFNYNKSQVQNRITELRNLAEANSQIYDLHGDEIVILENLWERIVLNLPSSSTSDAATVLSVMPKLEADLRELIFQAGYATIPPRLNQHLKQLRPGRTLDFHGTFEDELPNREDRVKILQMLYQHPLAVEEGIIDVENGVVYRASKNPSRRLASFGLIVATFLAGIGIIFALANLGSSLNLENWPVNANRFTELLVGYLFITIGGAVHIGIDVLKQARANKSQSFLAIEDMVLWIHVKELSIIAGVASLIVGIVGLALLTQKIDWATAFFVGYSIDSFVDLFLQRFTKTVATNTDAIKQSLTP